MKVVIGGCGATGAHAAPLVARDPRVSSILLADFDRYEPRNLESQNIGVPDVGRSKVDVLARRLRRDRPDLEVVAFRGRVESLPRGIFSGAIVLGCLDNRAGRQWLGQAAWRVGAPFLDSGVEAAGRLARVNFYVPGEENACLECAWDDADYRLLEQAYACAGAARGVAPTGAPACLGALAASLQALECLRLVRGEPGGLAPGGQVMIDARSHRHYLTRVARSGRCRFDHGPWRLETLAAGPANLTVRGALSMGGGRLEAPGDPLVRALSCAACGARRAVLRLRTAVAWGGMRCAGCSGPLAPAGWDLIESAGPHMLPPGADRWRLSRLGFRSGDLFRSGAGGDTFYRLGGQADARQSA